MSRPIENLGPDLEKALTRAVNELTLSVNEEIVSETPVDTGFARASWIPSVGSPAVGTGGAPGAPSGAAAAQGQAEVATNPDLSRSLHITNNVEYIQKLNDGHSGKTAPLFVERGIQNGISNLDGRTIK